MFQFLKLILYIDMCASLKRWTAYKILLLQAGRAIDAAHECDHLEKEGMTLNLSFPLT